MRGAALDALNSDRAADPSAHTHPAAHRASSANSPEANMINRFALMVPPSLLPSSKFQVPSSKFQVPCSRVSNLEPGTSTGYGPAPGRRVGVGMGTGSSQVMLV